MRKRTRLTVLVLFAFASGLGVALAASHPGDRDPGFTTTNPSISSGNDRALALDVAGDGSFYAAGTSGNDWLLAHYSSSGALLGSTTTDFGGGVDVATGVLVTGSNVLVVGSATVSGMPQFGMALYDGTTLAPVASFAGTGKFTTDFGSGSSIASAVVPATGGDFLVGGTWTPSNNDRKFAFALITPGGALDTAGTLGATGKTSFDTDAGNFTNETLSTLVAQGSNYFAGGANNAQKGVVVKLDAGAAPVAGFGTAGIRTLTSMAGRVYSLAPGASGQIAASGAGVDNGHFVGIVSLLSTADGSDVSGFGSAGTLTTRVPAFTDSYVPVIVHDDAKHRFLLAGPVNNGFLFDHASLYTGAVDDATGSQVPNWGPSSRRREAAPSDWEIFDLAPDANPDIVNDAVLGADGSLTAAGYGDYGAGKGDEPEVWHIFGDEDSGTPTGTATTQTPPPAKTETTPSGPKCSVRPTALAPCYDLVVTIDPYIEMSDNDDVVIAGYSIKMRNKGPDETTATTSLAGGRDSTVRPEWEGKGTPTPGKQACAEGKILPTQCTLTMPAGGQALLRGWTKIGIGGSAAALSVTAVGGRATELNPPDNTATDVFEYSVPTTAIGRAAKDLLTGTAVTRTPFKGSRMAGRAAHGRLAKIEIAVARLGRRGVPSYDWFRTDPGNRAGCKWLTGPKVHFSATTPATRSCVSPRWLRATGTKRWHYRFRTPLPPGRYVAFARATTTAKAVEGAATSGLGNRRAFVVG